MAVKLVTHVIDWEDFSIFPQICSHFLSQAPLSSSTFGFRSPRPQFPLLVCSVSLCLGLLVCSPTDSLLRLALNQKAWRSFQPESCPAPAFSWALLPLTGEPTLFSLRWTEPSRSAVHQFSSSGGCGGQLASLWALQLDPMALLPLETQAYSSAFSLAL